MSSKEFCKSGDHSYEELDVVKSIFSDKDILTQVWIVVACIKCDSKFLREIGKPIP